MTKFLSANCVPVPRWRSPLLSNCTAPVVPLKLVFSRCANTLARLALRCTDVRSCAARPPSGCWNPTTDKAIAVAATASKVNAAKSGGGSAKSDAAGTKRSFAQSSGLSHRDQNTGCRI
eukprot:4917385-Prymnesium_polylepis.1